MADFHLLIDASTPTAFKLLIDDDNRLIIGAPDVLGVPTIRYTLEGPSKQKYYLEGPSKQKYCLEGPSKQKYVLQGK